MWVAALAVGAITATTASVHAESPAPLARYTTLDKLTETFTTALKALAGAPAIEAPAAVAPSQRFVYAVALQAAD